uniref:Uncharacterized protein n=1 Tax=Panthera leo TaxID=9689 RepID=A0A8C8XLJ2_PANLE
MASQNRDPATASVATTHNFAEPSGVTTRGPVGKTLQQELMTLMTVAPGWLSWLSSRLLTLVQVTISSLKFEPHVGLCADSNGVCLGFSLSSPPLLMCSISLSLSK